MFVIYLAILPLFILLLLAALLGITIPMIYIAVTIPISGERDSKSGDTPWR